MKKRRMHGFIKHLVYKLIIAFFSIFLIASITFILFEHIPGNIYNVDGIKSENVIENIKKKYGLDKPVAERYFIMIGNLLRLDFGHSFINGQSVNSIILERFPVSMKLGIIAILVASINGIITASIIGMFKHHSAVIFFKTIVILSYSLPTFEIATVAQYLFCVRLGLFSVLYSNDIWNMILPIIILSLSPTTFITRLLYKRISEEKDKEYIIAGRFRGVSEVALYIFGVLKNSLNETFTVIGNILAGLLAGSFTVEVIFSIPGLGRYFVNAITNRDYPLVMGLTVFYAFLVISFNYIAELIIFLNRREVHEM